MKFFDHEKLDVYQVSLEVLALADEAAAQLPRGRSYLAHQLRRAVTSVPLNIAEGAGEFSHRDKARFYRIALRSATECAAILDVCTKLAIAEQPTLRKARKLLHRTVAMLTQLIRSQRHACKSGPGPGPGPGPGQRKS